MTAVATTPRFTVLDEPVPVLPGCPGVYRFLDGDGKALYIGKSINIRSRVRTHLAPGGQGERQRRMLHATERVDCRPTAGEAGALLLENAAIKREIPLFNRRQRSLRRMWSITLDENSAGFLQPQVTCFPLDQPTNGTAYGSYASRYHGRKALDKLARAEALCPRVLALEKGRGPCFQHQIGRCHGACIGSESASAHNARLLAALAGRRLSAWPVTGPVLLREQAGTPCSGQPAQEWHLLHNWMYLGTFTAPDEARQATTTNACMFDRDTHRILRGILARGDVALHCPETLAPVAWPRAGSSG